VLELPAPKTHAPRCTGIRLWVAEKIAMLLRAEELDANGKPARRLSIKSFKKIDDQWMIKDLVVEDVRTGDRTLLRVDGVQTRRADGTVAGPSP
jgi:hypothetical protein